MESCFIHNNISRLLPSSLPLSLLPSKWIESTRQKPIALFMWEELTKWELNDDDDEARWKISGSTDSQLR